jgi:hypothetical protein
VRLGDRRRWTTLSTRATSHHPATRPTSADANHAQKRKCAVELPADEVGTVARVRKAGACGARRVSRPRRKKRDGEGHSSDGARHPWPRTNAVNVVRLAATTRHERPTGPQHKECPVAAGSKVISVPELSSNEADAEDERQTQGPDRTEAQDGSSRDAPRSNRSVGVDQALRDPKRIRKGVTVRDQSLHRSFCVAPGHIPPELRPSAVVGPLVDGEGALGPPGEAHQSPHEEVTHPKLVGCRAHLTLTSPSGASAHTSCQPGARPDTGGREPNGRCIRLTFGVGLRHGKGI